MNFNHPDRGGSTIVTKTVCAIVFWAFSLAWLYYFQADVISVAQYVLSDGLTRYDQLVGAMLITAVLWLLQLGVALVVKLTKRFHALTYLPSMLCLAVISDINSDIDQRFSLGAWYWVFPLILLVWVLLVAVARGLQLYDTDRASHLFSRRVWVNMLIMVLMIVGVVSVANTNAVFHYRSHAETALLKGDLDEALTVGRRSLETDASLTMLRVYALSRKGRLGDCLFKYPIQGSSEDMLPLGGHARSVVYPVDSIYRYLGAIPKAKASVRLTTAEYLRQLELQGKARRPVADYRLCGWLIDRDLDSFARNLQRYYSVNDSLPRHYREALVLYTHMRSVPVLVYHEAVLDEDYDDLQKLEAEYPDATERKVRVEEKYAGSYWYYYKYCR